MFENYRHESGAAYRYQVVPETGSHDDLGEYPTCGLCLWMETAQGKTALGILHDVSSNEACARQMAERFNAGQLFPIHARDAVADFLP